MTQPTILPTGYAGDYTDYLKAKVDRSGAVRRAQGAIPIPATTATDTIIGLFPFQAGFSFAGLSASVLYSADLDSSTNVTLDWGVVYQDTVQGADNLVLVASASTVPQTGGWVVPGNPGTNDWATFVSTGNGWVTAQVNATTTTTGSLTFNCPFTYDQPVI